MKKLYIFSLLAFITFGAFTSCKDDPESIISSEYDVIIGLRNSGQKKVNLYKTGKDGEYNFVVLKGGKTPSKSAQAEISVLSQSDLIVLGHNNGVEYNLLPENLYQISDNTLNFNSGETALDRSISFKTDEIETYLQGKENVVLPLVIKSSTDSVNANKDMIMLSFDVLSPLLRFMRPETNSIVLSPEDKSQSFDLVLTLPFLSEWNFDANIALNEEIMKQNPNEYVPMSAITLSHDGQVTFPKGEDDSEPLRVTINNENFVGPLKIPFKIKSSSLDWMKLQEEDLVVNIEANKVPLKVSQLSTNAQEPSEGPIANAIDNNPETFFHSAWSINVGAPHYFQVHLLKPVTTFMWGFQGRHNNNAGDIKRAKIEVSDDGNSWTEAGTSIFDLKPVFGGIYYSAPIKLKKPTSYIRITPLEAGTRVLAQSQQKFFYFAEFMLYAN